MRSSRSTPQPVPSAGGEWSNSGLPIETFPAPGPPANPRELFFPRRNYQQHLGSHGPGYIHRAFWIDWCRKVLHGPYPASPQPNQRKIRQKPTLHALRRPPELAGRFPRAFVRYTRYQPHHRHWTSAVTSRIFTLAHIVTGRCGFYPGSTGPRG